MNYANIATSICVNGTPVAEVEHNGRNYIEGRDNSEYTLRVTNLRNSRIKVIISVDGLSVMDGKPAGKNSSGFLVNAGSFIDVPGWMVDENIAAKFIFKPTGHKNPSTYLEQMKADGFELDVNNIGLIGFMVFEEKYNPKYEYGKIFRDYEKQHQPKYPFYDPNVIPTLVKPWYITISTADTRNMSITASSVSNISHTAINSVGTGFGDATEFKTTKVEFEVGNHIATIEYEYDTITQLKKKGVPVDGLISKPKRSAFPADGYCKTPKGWVIDHKL